MGDATAALLAGHGVFVLGGSARAVHQRAVALEQRCQHAWHVRAAGNRPLGPARLLPRHDGAEPRRASSVGFWEAAVRAELRADPTLLDYESSRLTGGSVPRPASRSGGADA